MMVAIGVVNIVKCRNTRDQDLEKLESLLPKGISRHDLSWTIGEYIGI